MGMGHFMDDQEIEGHAKTRATGRPVRHEWRCKCPMCLADDNRRLRAALDQYANGENWHLGRRFDPNSSRFDGIQLATAALNGKDP